MICDGIAALEKLSSSGAKLKMLLIFESILIPGLASNLRGIVVGTMRFGKLEKSFE